MFKSYACLGGVCLAVLLARTAYMSAAPAPQASRPVTTAPRVVLDKYCLPCHNERLKRGDLVLSQFDPDNLGSHVDVWERVVRKLRAGVMPPPGSPRPDSATHEALIA